MPRIREHRIPQIVIAVPRIARPLDRAFRARARAEARIVEALGRSATIAEWSEETGLRYETIRHRLLRGWHPDKAVTVPMRAVSRWANDKTRMPGAWSSNA